MLPATFNLYLTMLRSFRSCVVFDFWHLFHTRFMNVFFCGGGGALRATFLKQHLSQVEFYSHLIGCLNMYIF